MNENVKPAPAQAQVKKPPKREFNSAEMLYAWLCLLFGYLFCRVFPVVEAPLGGLIFIAVLYLVTAVILKLRGGKFTATAIILALSALIIQASMILCANSTIHFFAYLYALWVYFYCIYSAFGNSIQKGFSDFIAADFLKAAFVMPFESFGSVFAALSASTSKKGGKSLARVLIGIGLAIIPTAIIVSQLSYDKGFTDILNRIFDFDFDKILGHIGSFILGIPLAMYLFGLFVSSVDKKKSDSMSAENCTAFLGKLKFTPIVTVCIAVLPVLVVYIIFFASQWQYYVSGFAGVLPDEFSYAEYARYGFFQLCTVSFINFVIIAAIGAFTKHGGKGADIVKKLLVVIISLMTLVLIATALAKMLMYIKCYGLTPRRVYSSWGMLLLAALFLLIIAKQFIRPMKLIAAMLLVCLVFFGVLALSGVDSFIAEYNVDRYLDGTLETVDVDTLMYLGDAGVEQLVRLVKALDEQNGTNIAQVKPQDLHSYSLYTDLVLALRGVDYSDCDFFSFTLPQSRAKAAIEELGITPWGENDYMKLPFNLRP